MLSRESVDLVEWLERAGCDGCGQSARGAVVD